MEVAEYEESDNGICDSDRKGSSYQDRTVKHFTAEAKV